MTNRFNLSSKATFVIFSLLIISLILPACGRRNSPSSGAATATNPQTELGVSQDAESATPTPASRRKPGETSDPTPVPTYSPLRLTPIPLDSDPAFYYTPVPGPPLPSPRPDEPFNLLINADRPPGPALEIANNQASLIVIGTVKNVGRSQWNTPDGLRPADPHVGGGHLIFRPVSITVGIHLKGDERPSEVVVAAIGGHVGADSVTWSSDGMHDFSEGQHVVLFLSKDWRGNATNKRAVWRIIERYTVSLDGLAFNEYDRRPLAELIDAITNIVNSLPMPAALGR